MDNTEVRTTDRPFMTVKEAAKYISLSVGTLYQYVHYNKIPYWRTRTGRVTFKKEELDNWMLAERVAPVPIV